MEETGIEKCNFKKSEPVAVPKSFGSLTESRSIELIDAVDKQDTVNCGGFSIRGYTAAIRKRDWKISWPFFMLDDHNKLEDSPNWIPPIHVRQFRWWGNNSGFQVVSEEDICDRSEFCKVIARNMGGDREKDVSIVYSSREEENANKMICGTIGGATEVEPHEIDIGTQKDNSPNAAASPISKLHSIGLDESDCEFLENNDNSFGNESRDQHSASQNGALNGGLCQKKARKVRLLSDIIKSEALNASRKVHILHEDAETSHFDAAVIHSKESPDASMGTGLQPGLKSSVGSQENCRKTVMGKKRKRACGLGDKGSSLMCLPKVVPEKVVSTFHKGLAEVIHIETATDNSKAGVGLPPRLKSHVATEKRCGKTIMSKNQNKMTRFEDGESSLAPHSKDVSAKVCTSTGDSETNNDEIAIHSKSSWGAFTKRELHPDPVATHRKVVPRQKRNKMPRVEDISISRKDSSAKTKYKGITDFHGNQKITKKRSAQRSERTTKPCEDPDFDDIPMDIVGFMAKNQHERSLSNAKDTEESRYNMSQTENTMSASIMDFTEVLEKEVSAVLPKKNFSIERSQSSNAVSGIRSTGMSTENAHKTLDGCPSHINSEYDNSHMNINHREQPCIPTPFSSFSRYQRKPSSGIQPPVTDSGRNRDGRSLNSIEFLEACPDNQTISQKNLCGEAQLDRSSIQLNSRLCDINTTHKVDELYHTNMFSHPTDPLPKRNPNTDTHGNHVLKSVIPFVGPQSQNQKDNASETNKGTLPTYAFSCAENGDGYQPSGMSPLDLYSNENIPAMQLLRLMDQGASSSTLPTYAFSRLSKIGLGHSLPNTTAKSKYFRSESLAGGFPNNGMLPSKSPQKEKTKIYPSLPQSSGYVSRDGNSGKSRESVPIHDTQKKFLSVSDSIPHCKDYQTGENLMENVELGMCTVNQNPAEISVLDEGNEYMIGSEDLEHINMFSSKDRVSPINPDGHKRKRMMKLTALQGR
ncbi:protein EMBRYONIC FLOWER 1-like isoform X2 [Tasmannia lanceolata]|uniref:protein EMBRYONIC FLOWER 1-like isoform X2 n=1 Tax=Tasmannia lanceolata TaxID=3420 RepID=UPI0040644866